ncbi:MAG: MFS transporter [Rhodospirillaceae bacterium]
MLFVVAGICGALAIWPLARIREPRLAPALEPPKLTALLEKPFQDPNFRNLMIFLVAWNFAVNLAAPFFTVHMFQRLELNVFTVTALATTSQVANIAVLATFGRLTDRFSAKSVMAVSAPLFLLCVFAWVFTTRPAEATTTIALLAGIHLVTGIATAGVTIASTTIAMRLAPREHATAYLTANGLLTSLAAGIAPVLGGLTADFFINQRLSLVLHWHSAERDIAFETLKIEHWDFFFVLAGLFGLYALHRLSHVVEKGSVSERVVIGEFLAETKRNIQNISPVAGLKQLTEWPFAMIQRRVFRSRLEAVREARRQARSTPPPGGGASDQTGD